MAGTAVVGSLIENLTSMVAQYLLEEASLVSSFRKDFDSLCDELESIKSLLKDAGGKRSSTSLCNWLEKLEDFLDDAVDIVEECRAAGSFCNPIFRYKMGGKIKKLNERIIQIHVSAKYIKYVGSVLDLNARVDGQYQARQRSNANKELPPVGMENDIQKITDLLLKEDGPRVIAVIGMGGQGKTLLVQSVFKSQRVKKQFERLFWVVVSQKSDDKNVLKQTGIDSIDDLEEGKRCLFVLDDVWDIGHALLEIIGSLVQRKHNIVITSRHRKVAESFEDAYIHKMSYLSEENSLKLFCNHARLPEELKNVDCHPILAKCGGLPLAIKTIGASMAKVGRLPTYWEQALSRLNDLSAMNNLVLPSLRLSYEALHEDLKPCFLYFSVFPKGIEIDCQKLVHMWIAQGLVSSQVAVAEDAYDAGRLYIEELIDRCLIEVSRVGGDETVKLCKIHDLLHDLAVSESLKQTKCLLKPRKQLDSLPVGQCLRLRRISVIKNDICAINQAIQCPGLRILLLSENLRLTSITASFFNNLTYLTVLDLSYTAIASLPKSIGKLKHLKFLNLSRTNISELPEYLSGLGRLQFLDVSHCFKLSNLHSGIGKNRLMLYLNVESCDKLKWLPVGLSKLGHLQTLKGTLSLAHADADAKALRVRDLRGLTLLQHLELSLDIILSSEDIIQLDGATIQLKGVTIQLKDGTFGEMKKMQTLSFKNNSPHFLALPNDMGVMERLQVVCLGKCVVPEWIFGLENLMELELEDDNSVGNVYKGLALIPNLKKLHLSYNHECTEFPEEFGKCKAFPKLEELIIDHFDCLKKFPSLQDTAMPMLKYFRLRWCKALKNIAEGLENLRSLEEVELSKGDLDLSEGPWLDILKARQIKIKVL